MKKCLLIFLVVFTLPYWAKAEHTRTFKFRADTTWLTTVYKHLKVVDLRKEKDLGFVKTGIGNRKTTLITEQSLDAELVHYYDRIRKPDGNTFDELVLILYELRVEEPTAGPIGTFCIDAAFFGGDKGKYSLLGKVDTFFEDVDLIDLTYRIVDDAHDYLDYLLLKYAIREPFRYDAVVMDSSAIRSWRVTKQSECPILNAAPFTRGIYRTVDDFMNNHVSEAELTEEYKMDGGDQKYTFYHVQKNGRKGAKLEEGEYFAIYDGTTWLIQNGNYARLMNFNDGAFTAKLQLTGVRNPIWFFGIIGAIASRDSKTKAIYECRFDPTIKHFRPYRRLGKW